MLTLLFSMNFVLVSSATTTKMQRKEGNIQTETVGKEKKI